MKKINKLLMVIIFAFLFASCTPASTENNNTDIAQHIYSHRGASGEEIEHTFAAYDLAIKYGSKYIEQDVITSKDGTLWIAHDDSAKNIFGVDKLFLDMTDDELSSLRTKDNQKMLKMQDVFDRYKKTITYVIELKENDVQTDAFINIVKQNDMIYHVIVQAKYIEPLNKLAQALPEIPRLFLVTQQHQLEQAVMFENVDIVSAYKRLMTAENVRLIHAHNKKINIWTLNTIQEITKAIELNVDTYFTDYTAKAFILEKEFRKRKAENFISRLFYCKFW